MHNLMRTDKWSENKERDWMRRHSKLFFMDGSANVTQSLSPSEADKTAYQHANRPIQTKIRKLQDISI